MTHKRQRLLAFSLATVLWGSLGVTCEDFVANPSTADVPVQLQLELEDEYWVTNYFVTVVNMVVIVNEPVQAVAMALSWDHPSVTALLALPHEDFNDYSMNLFSETARGATSISNIIDFRHGANPVQGTFRVARMVVVQKDATGPLKLRASGEIAGPDGTLYDVVISEPLTVTPAP